MPRYRVRLKLVSTGERQTVSVWAEGADEAGTAALKTGRALLRASKHELLAIVKITKV